MDIKQKISLDFGRDTLPITILAKQGDSNTRYIEITPLNCGQPYKIEEGVTPRLGLTKPDGHIVLNDQKLQDGIILVELTEQCLAVAGIAVAEIELYKGEELLSSQIFYIDISAKAYNPDAPISSDEFNALTEAFAKVDAAASSANEAVEKAETATENANKAKDGALAATTAANNAAENANDAATGAEKVNISAAQTPTGATISITDRTGAETEVHIDTLTAVNTWEDIKNVVRLGLGSKLFPVGYEFTTLDANTGLNIVWVVRGHDHHAAENNRLEHTMTLETKCVYSSSSGAQRGIVFDASEALYYAENGLAAGTYNFTVANQAWYTADNGKTFQFTLTNAVPAGGQIALSMTYNATLEGKSVKTYSSPTSTNAIETATLTEGAAGTSLGTTDGTENINYMHRIIFGSNNYAQSAARQWLNSDKLAGAVWTPTNKFDRPPSWATSYNGFMHGLPEDFLAVIQPAIIPCRTNSVYECNSLDGTEFTINKVYSLADKFFLLSRPEIYGDWDSSSYKDGERLEYYEGLTNAERKKFDVSGSVRVCWLRSPFPGYANNERIVNTDGSLNNRHAYNSYGVAPACIIA